MPAPVASSAAFAASAAPSIDPVRARGVIPMAAPVSMTWLMPDSLTVPSPSCVDARGGRSNVRVGQGHVKVENHDM